VRKAFSLTTDEEQNQCCWQGRHELQVHDHINSIEDVQVAPSQVPAMSSRSRTCTVQVRDHVNSTENVQLRGKYFSPFLWGA